MSKKFNLEQALSELEAIVDKMDAGAGISLEESLKQFAAGIKLSAQCQKELQAAEHKVQVLVDQNQLETDTE
ncbi:MAG: exodeoxyribonuclease VII small subunit [Thiotrichales bacterium]|nr:MAG: exodeoxyribonuclease VII small subunit [Thiotrichales bacterium]